MKIYVILVNGQTTKMAFSTKERAEEEISKLPQDTKTVTDYSWDEDAQQELPVDYEYPLYHYDIDEMELDVSLSPELVEKL